MPSSDSRKFKRAKLQSNVQNERPRTRKRGRNALRNITRTSRRHGGEASLPESDAQSDDSSAPAEEEPETDTNADAYSALLTLLQENEVDDDSPEQSTKYDVDEEPEPTDSSEEEPVDSGEESVAEVSEIEEEEVASSADPFNYHFNDENFLEKQFNECEDKSSTKATHISEKERYEKEGYVVLKNWPALSEQAPWFKGKEKDVVALLNSLNVKQRIVNSFKISAGLLPDQSKLVVGGTAFSLLESIFQYQNVNFQYTGNDQLKKVYQDYYVHHILNHVFKTRDKILRNTSKLQHYEELAKEGKVTGDAPELRDQGYTRPKVLILLPTRNFAFEVVNKIIEFSGMEGVENKNKFKKQFFSDFDINQDLNTKKPDDFAEFFHGNSNDFFCLGMKLTRKVLKLYSAFNQSDIIVASPLGLKMIIGNEKKNKQNADFLSSIEVVVLDQAHGLLMQNWEHVNEILSKHMNQTPKNFNDLKCDFSRIRMWQINEKSKYITQLLCFSKFSTPEMKNLTSSRSKNMQGVGVLKPFFSDNTCLLTRHNKQMLESGVLNRDTKLRKLFTRFASQTPMDDPNDRFQFFINVTLPGFLSKASYQDGTLIYIPSYYDYLRVKNHLQEKSKLSFVDIDEYSSQSRSSKARSLFELKPASNPIMLYTERLHFYKRFDLKGVKNILFYGLPSDAEFFTEFLSMIVRNKLRINRKLAEGKQKPDFDINLSIVRVCYSKFDILKLERLVGSQRAGLLCYGEDEIYEFR